MKRKFGKAKKTLTIIATILLMASIAKGQTIEGLSPLKRSEGVCNIDISKLTKGIYIIELTTKEGIYRSKFVKE